MSRVLFWIYHPELKKKSLVSDFMTLKPPQKSLNNEDISYIFFKKKKKKKKKKNNDKNVAKNLKKSFD